MAIGTNQRSPFADGPLGFINQRRAREDKPRVDKEKDETRVSGFLERRHSGHVRGCSRHNGGHGKPPSA
jgi:hypothetical protein